MLLPDAYMYASCLVRINLKKSPAADGAHTCGCCCFVLKCVVTIDYPTNTSISAKTAAVPSAVEALCVREGKVSIQGHSIRANTVKLTQHQRAKHL